jgi:hypothetical protein
MSHEKLAKLTQPQRDQLAFVELHVRFIEEMRRQDLVTRFGLYAEVEINFMIIGGDA